MKITVDELKAAIKKTGYGLVRQQYHGFTTDDKPCGCPLTVMYMANHPEYLGSNEVFTWAKNKYGNSYSTGVINGFDYGKVLTGCGDNEYDDGANNGIALRVLLKE